MAPKKKIESRGEKDFVPGPDSLSTALAAAYRNGKETAQVA